MEIQDVDKGSSPTLLHASLAKEVIKNINKWERGPEVKIQEIEADSEQSGEFHISDSNVKLELKLKSGGGDEKDYYVVINGALYTQTFIVKKDSLVAVV